MKKIKVIISIVGIFFLIGCTKETPSVLSDGVIHISLKDSSGIDLFDPNQTQDYNSMYTRIYYWKNNDYEEQLFTNEDALYGFHIIKVEHGYEMSCRVDNSDSKTKTLIKWAGGEEDLIECHFKIQKRSILQKVFWNEELKWERPETVSDGSPVTARIEIVKKEIE